MYPWIQRPIGMYPWMYGWVGNKISRQEHVGNGAKSVEAVLFSAFHGLSQLEGEYTVFLLRKRDRR